MKRELSFILNDEPTTVCIEENSQDNNRTHHSNTHIRARHPLNKVHLAEREL